MKKFTTQAAQGDLLIRRVESIPATATKAEPEGGLHVLAHSETGHHHAVAARLGVVHYRTETPMVSFLEVLGDDVVLEHHRPFDTHEAIAIGPGCYEVRRQREHTPEGWRAVAD